MRRPLYGWLAADAIGSVGTRVSAIAIPWFVLTTTGSATKTGLVSFCEIAPLVVLKALSGPFIDRVGARRIGIAADALSVAAVGAIPLLHALGLLSFGALLVLVAVAGALRGPGDVAKEAMIPALVAEAEVSLERATGLSGAVDRSAAMLGAAFAGGLVALIGAAGAVAADAGSFALSALLLAWSTTAPINQGDSPLDLRSRVFGSSAPSVNQGDSPLDSPRYVDELRSGWVFLRQEPLLVGITVMVCGTNLLDAAYSVVLVPSWARDAGHGAGAVGLLFGVFSGASILGAVAAAAYADRLPRLKTFGIAFLLTGAPRLWILASGASPAAVFAVVAVSGFASGCINPILGAVILERIPKEILGRVMALSTALAFGMIPFGGLVGGGLIAAFGVHGALAAVGGAYFILTLLPVIQRRWREMERRPDFGGGVAAR